MKHASPNYFALDIPDLPRKYWEVLFPKAFWNDLKLQSEANGLDPYLVASLIRQESEFNPNAVSRANAVGLMQLLPKTGKLVAKEEKLKRFNASQLYTPAVNLQLGTRYFRGMVDKFGSFEYALAAYNAGSDRVEEWLGQGKYRDPQEFVESIPFTETREYVQAILRNASVYKAVVRHTLKAFHPEREENPQRTQSLPRPARFSLRPLRPFFACFAVKSFLRLRGKLQSSNPQLFRERLPLCIHQSLGFRVHLDFIRPRPGKAFGRPFTGGIDAHLRAVVRQSGSVIERIDRPQRELDIALRIDVIQNFQSHVAKILHVHIFIHHDNALREHRLPQRPDRAHHLARLPRIRLANRNDHQVMKDAFHGKIDVDQFRNREPHQRQEYSLDGFAHVGILHGRFAYDGGRVNWDLCGA